MISNQFSSLVKLQLLTVIKQVVPTFTMLVKIREKDFVGLFSVHTVMIFAKVDFLLIDNDNEKKNSNKKYSLVVYNLNTNSYKTTGNITFVYFI